MCEKLDLLADWRKIWQAEKSAENLADPVKRKIWYGKFRWKIWKIPNMENLVENLRKLSTVWKICGSCTAAENLRKNSLTGKSAENMENPAENLDLLENLECKVYLTFHGKSGVRYSAENLTLICLENLQ